MHRLQSALNRLCAMSTTIDQYREAKNNYLKLRNQAKKELIARFNELAGELLHLQRELLEDFGEKIAMPSKAKKPSTAKTTKVASKPAPEPLVPPPTAPTAPMVALQKQVEKQKKKLSDTQAAGKPAKVIEDRLYELEDELRLLKEK
jgi:hypothetical protein